MAKKTAKQEMAEAAELVKNTVVDAVLEAKEKAEERLDMLLSNGDYVRRAAPPPQADVTIDELFNNGMSLRSFNCLRRAGLNTAGDIIKQGEASLMRIEHLGRKSFNEIVKLMHQLGLRMSWE